MKEFFEDWEDNDRMRTLFADFRPKNVNPEGWLNKMNTWISVINAWCKSNRKVILSVKDVTSACERKGDYPHCLEEVFSYMSRAGILTEAENALRSPSNQSWASWSMDLLVKQPVSWGWRTVSSFVYGRTPAACSQKYVHTTLLKEIGSSVLQKLESEVDQDSPTILMSQCQVLCKELCDGESFPLVISHLQNQGQLTVFVESGSQYIKLHVKAKGKTEVTETDVGFVRLQKTLQKVEGEMDKLQTDIQSCTDQAKLAMKAGQKSKVQQLLRKRKQIERLVETKMKTCEQLEAMIHKLQSTSSNQEVIEALKAGVDAQKKLATKGFNIDSVEDTMADIQDVYNEQDEIAQAMASGHPFEAGDDDSALEKELDDLLEEQNRNRALNLPNQQPSPSKDVHLPDVPLTDPSPIKITSTNRGHLIGDM